MSTTDVKTHMNFINGEWTPSDSGRTYSVYNPAHKDRLLGHFQLSNPEDTLRAVAAASEAAEAWADTPAPVRAQVLFKALEIMERRGEEIARTITEEEGKPLPDARGEVKRAMNIMEYAAGEGRRMFGYTTPSELPNTVAYTVRRPLGVVGIITPWNFPIAIPAWKMAPALICGNAHRVQACVEHAAVRRETDRGVRRGGGASRRFQSDHRPGRQRGQRAG